MASKKTKKPTGAPKTWQKATRMNPMQRFKMYNPLSMEFSGTISNSLGRSNINFSFDRNKQHHLQKIHLEKIKKTKQKLTKQITSTMNNSNNGYIKPFRTEKTFKIDQNELSNLVNLNTSKKIFSLDNLSEYGSYKIDYTPNGQYLGLCGQRGHLAVIKWSDYRLIAEEYFPLNNNDYIHDIKFAFNESMICTAQREGVYIYNTKCVETHVLRRSMPFPLALEYLPYHFLLCSIGMKGKLVYFDISQGKKIATRNTKLGICDTICKNSRNAIINLGHNNGTVTLWTPTNQSCVARIKCHKNNKITAISIDNTGYQMATSDNNGYLKIWDLRTYQQLTEYKSNSSINNLSYSQRGLLAFSTGRTAVIWNVKKNFTPIAGAGLNTAGEQELLQKKSINQNNLYLQHTLNKSTISSLKFCPYEDVLGIGTTAGFESILIPGAGEPNYDLFENDPHQNRKQRNNKIVYKLLDKLSPEMIQMDPNFIGDSTKNIENKYKSKQKELKWARKNVTRNVKNGYRGVLRKRYSKFHHMKDLHLRQNKLIKQLNYKKKINSKLSKLDSIDKKEKVVKHLTRHNKRDSAPNALSRFNGPKQSNHQQFKSKWRRKPTRLHF